MKIRVTLLSEPPRTFELQGRLGWTLFHLDKASAKGITTIERPAPRWSAYIHELRKLGIQIETEMEPHEGAYSGHHARYRLACEVQVTTLGNVVAT
ncbi:MAG: hypothetical protein V7695_07015 [Sulfitobacter sp.]